MRARIGIISAVVLFAAAAFAAVQHFQVKPDEFDPAHTHLVQGAWLDGIGCPTDCTQDYPSGAPVTLTATPSEGFVFDHWTGDCSGPDPSRPGRPSRRRVPTTEPVVARDSGVTAPARSGW